ncbi:MAG: hypothetical protein IKN54_05135, partial [Lachnospiraceae bacterium]|nr:hypothetical protein [Lachnospiraceae bacterium]
CLYLFDKYIDVLEEYRNTPEKIDGRRIKGGFSIPDRIKLKDILLNIKFDIQRRHNWNAEDYIYSFYCTYNPILCLEEISDGVSFVNEILKEYKEKLGVRKYPDYL